MYAAEEGTSDSFIYSNNICQISVEYLCVNKRVCNGTLIYELKDLQNWLELSPNMTIFQNNLGKCRPLAQSLQH